MKKKFVFFGFVSVLLLVAVMASAAVKWEYELWDGTATITGFANNEYGESAIIPDELDGYAVTGIRNYSFINGGTFSSLTIPASVANIVGNPFFGSSIESFDVDSENPAFSSVDGALFNKKQSKLVAFPSGKGEYAIPEGVTTIGEQAFSCYGLTSVTIPASVTDINTDSFLYCDSLNFFDVEAGNPAYSTVDGVLFDEQQTTLVAYPSAREGGYTISEGVTSIGDNAFGYGYRLTDVTIPDSVTSFGDWAFSNCLRLPSVRTNA